MPRATCAELIALCCAELGCAVRLLAMSRSDPQYGCDLGQNEKTKQTNKKRKNKNKNMNWTINEERKDEQMAYIPGPKETSNWRPGSKKAVLGHVSHTLRDSTQKIVYYV